ncbi:eukaryotic protein [Schizosaccharomyces japonicus yFS275]|uniref:Eukaryotic protein n=1 Tax=Schizosaccharomyces japonicus (strain yFS275 / FY16936) TaxID=402676 RepID=B6K184_SCHJY|nr:eukaryotic protein [Schizosaccharomyces japonicus yFS275]EEB07705.1 eukaryotic protein [Schizosaccharomyces japonicus yFS275]
MTASPSPIGFNFFRRRYLMDEHQSSSDYEEFDIEELEQLSTIINEQSCTTEEYYYLNDSLEDEALSTAEQNKQNYVNKNLYEMFRSDRGYLKVTDMVAPLWCGVQHSYALLDRVERKTPAMEKGTIIHLKLELETTPPKERVRTDETLAEEPWALHILLQLDGLLLLTKNGITREFPIWGFYKDSLLFGIIDELTVLKTEKDDNLLSMKDNKTRGTITIPSQSQILGSELQLMYYYHLFQEYFQNADSWWDSFLKQQDLDGKKNLGQNFLKQAIETLPSIDPKELEAHNTLSGLHALATRLTKDFQLRSLSPKLTVTYRHNISGDVIRNHIFDMNSTILNHYFHEMFAYWHNEAEPKGVPENETFKCKYCEFSERCWWLNEKAIEVWNRKRKRLYP